MPTYEFKCDTCGNQVEVRRAIGYAEDPFYCAVCGDQMKKLFSPTPTIFKGGGFYKTGN